MSSLKAPKQEPNDPYQFPTHCCDCGVLLMGGATKHKEGCRILALIREHFPDWNPSE